MRTEKQKKSDAQEARWADLVGGEVVRGSGSGWRHRQDVKDETHLWECKGTDAASISFKCEWWDQLRGSAAADGLLPGSHVEIRGGEGRTRRLVVLDEGDYLSMKDELESRNWEIMELQEAMHSE